MKKQMHFFSFNPPKNLSQEEKWLLTVTFLEATNSVFNITNKNNSFSSTIPGDWDSESAENIINELNKLLDLRSQNAMEVHVKEARKK